MSGSSGRIRSADLRRVGNLVGLLALLVVVGVFVATAVPALVGADASFVVQSDSMSPSINAGAVVFVNDVSADQIAVGDVITFRSDGGQRVTHRVVAVQSDDGERRFRTKGDANEELDPDVVTPAEVVGRVGFHLPMIGYVVAFAGTKLGLLTLIIVPATALLVLELRDLFWSDGVGSEPDDAQRGEGQ